MPVCSRPTLVRESITATLRGLLNLSYGYLFTSSTENWKLTSATRRKDGKTIRGVTKSVTLPNESFTDGYEFRIGGSYDESRDFSTGSFTATAAFDPADPRILKGTFSNTSQGTSGDYTIANNFNYEFNSEDAVTPFYFENTTSPPSGYDFASITYDGTFTLSEAEAALSAASARIDWDPRRVTTSWASFTAFLSTNPETSTLVSRATMTFSRFRFLIDAVHKGSYFKITYDIAEFPAGWDNEIDDPDYVPPDVEPEGGFPPVPQIPDPDAPSPSFVSEDNVVEWSGPGTGSRLDPSWFTPWVEIKPPDVPGQRRVVNIRYTCYRGTKYGVKPQTIGEAFVP